MSDSILISSAQLGPSAEAHSKAAGITLYLMASVQMFFETEN